ncbi:cupin domain-containing protein [Sphingomonas ginsenosidivorax]|uniref:Cupin domain-containing protein n=1 Tax=Sphingomonas ginsenosidivorax TaxID=862135 RepID=A0A5C6UC17_9SPHN|nr:cupin domain-containing protein [Sphingomonas ginsenosidivorax]TXC70249.1 cupin domain-containing protein [Sphingomonas ginsenosidivorax]
MATTAPRFALFRASEACDFEESGVMSQAMPTETEMTGAVAAVAAGMLEGTTVKLLFALPGISLTHAWFKSGFPLPRHTHDVDCLYYIVAGSLRIGVETLAKGDGFFVGAGVPYSYVPGADGVEVLEFRGSNSFDIKLLADNPTFWTKAVDMVAGKREAWAREVTPSAL